MRQWLVLPHQRPLGVHCLSDLRATLCRLNPSPSPPPPHPTPPCSKLKRRDAEAGERASKLRRVWELAENPYDRWAAGWHYHGPGSWCSVLWQHPGPVTDQA